MLDRKAEAQSMQEVIYDSTELSWICGKAEAIREVGFENEKCMQLTWTC